VTRRLRLWRDTIETDVEVLGSGPPLVYLHGPWGARADRDFLDRLARHHTVYAPLHPGTSPGNPDAIHEVDTLHDLVVYYGELLDRLELGASALVGHSFGGMLACELAAAAPPRVGKLVLIDPIGLWRDDAPVRNWMILPEAERLATLFADPDGDAARRFAALPEDSGARAEAQAAFIWTQACTGKFVWPLPDKGLKKRIHRVGAPTLIVWGTHDRIVAPVYATEFAGRIAHARVELVEGAGHLPHLEQPEPVAALVRAFLAEG
jgi:pimeloyl-ACP methyl ester carboxylesterase